MSGLFSVVAATPDEVAATVVGDDIVADADVVMDRGITLTEPPAAVWPWLLQLGKRRAGWYLPGGIERFVPRSRRALRRIDPTWQSLAVGDVIPDYGGRDATFEVANLDAPTTLVFRSCRGRMNVSWAIALKPTAHDGRSGTRMHLRLRLGPVRRKRLANSAGELVDLLTIAGLAAGLQERLAARPLRWRGPPGPAAAGPDEP